MGTPIGSPSANADAEDVDMADETSRPGVLAGSLEAGSCELLTKLGARMYTGDKPNYFRV